MHSQNFPAGIFLPALLVSRPHNEKIIGSKKIPCKTSICLAGKINISSLAV